MKYIERLLKDTDYLKQLEELQVLEQDRIFCHHNLEHCLDTARIAWIYNLEAEKGIGKEDIYLSALLHDLGRIAEYKEGISHHTAGKQMAGKYLTEIDFPEERRKEILQAIEQHRRKPCKQEKMDTLAEVLQFADKQSRNCFFCKAEAECKWTKIKKNQSILY